MRTKEIRTIKKEVTIYKCDFCDYTTEKNTTYVSGYEPIAACSFCDKDICNSHRKYYEHFYKNVDYDDYDDAIALIVCPDCKPVIDEAWDWAEDVLELGDSMRELTLSRARIILKERAKETV